MHISYIDQRMDFVDSNVLIGNARNKQDRKPLNDEGIDHNVGVP